MHFPYNKNSIEKARNLRNNATKEENKLWYEYLSKHAERFLRQKPIDNYILDFYCPKKRIAIEVDGSQHYTEDGLEYDNIRTETLNEYDITIIRITNEEVRVKFAEVCQYIDDIISKAEIKNPPALRATPFLKGGLKP